MAVRRLAIGIVGLLILGACSPAGPPPPETSSPPAPGSTDAPASTTTSTGAPREPLLDPDGSYAVVVFTNHLPAFGLDPAGAADRPWARLHTARDYISMVRLIGEARAKVVLSYSPVLLEQIADTAAGRWDQAARITAIPAAELTAEDKAYIDEVFFVASPAQIDRYPRYRELADRRAQGRQLSTTEYRDLQVLFNLAWTSPLLLEAEPLATIANSGRRFAEADKQLLLDAHRAAASEFLTSLRSLWAEGLIEVATTPLANPTLPLMVRNRMDQDATDQIIRGAERASLVLGRDPRGMAPAGGLIDQTNGTAALSAGFEWLLLSGPESPTPFQLTSEIGNLLALVANPEAGKRIAESYFTMDPALAARDLIGAISAAMGDGSGVVAAFSADATEPWGRYEDGGLAFLRRVLQELATAQEFTAVLPSELNNSLQFDPGPWPELPDTYLRGDAELAAWALLADTRRELLRQREVGLVDAVVLEEAYGQILQAQGADWYWWYSPDLASGDDAYYDATFRGRLAEVWDLLGASPPDELRVPLQDPEPVPPTRLNRPVPATITIDNTIANREWSQAGLFDERSSDLIERVLYTFDDARLFLRVDFTTEVLGDSAPGFDLYLRGPRGTGAALTPRRNAIGFDAAMVVKWRATNPVQVSLVRPYRSDGTTNEERKDAGFDGNSIELELDLDIIEPAIRAGDRIDFRFVDVTGGPENGQFPAAAPGVFEFPNLGNGIELARIADRVGDDHGPGNYSYIVDSEIRAGAYDLAGLVVRLVSGPAAPVPDPADHVQFEITFRGPLANPWSAPAGFSHQTIDLYLDAATTAGAQRLLPGRVAAVEAGGSWDYAFTIDGWGASHYVVDGAGAASRLNSTPDYKLLADRRTFLVTVPRATLPAGDESSWRYGVAVIANQAIPTLGIHGLRALEREPGRFHLGGGTGAANDPMIIDLLHPTGGAQEAALTYPAPVIGSESELAIEQLARLPMLSG